MPPIEDATANLAPPGLAAAVVSTGGSAEFVTSGLADVRTLRPVSAHTTFLWFSMTKIVTATAVMRLYPARGQAVVMFGNLTRYLVEALAGTVAGRAG